ncbi:MAG: peptide chain release factor N(5)-glutamine methyltransferase [Balneola sp.]
MSASPSEWTVLSMLKWATDYFEEKGIRNPRFSIEWLLSYALKVKRLDLYLIFDRPLTAEDLATIKPLVKRRALHEPLQYITGETDFLNTIIKVKPGVLIPRMETEQLVELILEEHKTKENLAVLDIGTGSGCIPIALKINMLGWKVTATDISKEALLQASSNAQLNSVEVEFKQDDIFNSEAFSSDQLFDIIISNPPYILYDEKELLDEEVKNYEPERALFCESIATMYGAIEDFCSKHLRKGGLLYLEIHEEKGGEVSSLFEGEEWDTSILQDYDKKDRFVIAKKVK